jgi:hypothetical protein
MFPQRKTQGIILKDLSKLFNRNDGCHFRYHENNGFCRHRVTFYTISSTRCAFIMFLNVNIMTRFSFLNSPTTFTLVP